ncbi:MAG: PAS domain S-box protein, partial [Cyclobacteriaceae bacterium]|nr:PAS domain S-box protein [Cyclobacteriaceae bacterium]
MAIGKNVKSEKLIAEDSKKSPEAKKASASTSEEALNIDVALNVLNDACLISKTDKQGLITYVNDKFCEVAQYTREELIGKPHNVVRHPDMPKSVFKEVWSTIGKGKTFRGEIKNRCKDGSAYWVDAFICPVLGENGKPESYIGIRYDITEQVMANRAAENSQKKLNSALDQANDAVVNINSDKVIIFYNEAAVTLFGYSREEVMGQNVKMIVPEEHQRGHDKYVDDNINTGVNKVVGVGRELEMVKKGGERFWGHLSLSKAEVDGEVQYTAFIKDVSEQRRLKQETAKAIERMNGTLDQAVDAVVTINSDKIVTFFNKMAEKMFGWDREEVLGNNVKMIVPVEHQRPHDGYVDANMNTGVNKVVGVGRDLEMTRKDGSKFWGNLGLSKVVLEGEILYTA